PRTAGRTSATAAVGPRTGRVLWQRTLEGAVVPGAAVGVDGSVLQASNGGVLHALDPATGRDRWTYDAGSAYGSDLSATPAVLADGTVLWPGPGSALIALTPAGRLLWREELDGFVLSPAVVGSRVYVATSTGTVTAWDVTGPQRHRAWTHRLGGTSYSSPAVAPDGTVLVASDRTVTALADRGRSASVRWRYRARDTIEVSLAVGDEGTVVVGTNGDDEIGLRPDGSVRWRFEKGDWSYSSPVVRDGRAYFGDHLGYLDVVDVGTGRELHRDLGIPKERGTTSSGTGVWTAPLVDSAGNVFFGTAAGHVYGFGADGRRLWDLDTGAVVASYPALTADGTLVIGSTNGTVYGLRD
ncbi:MAG: PQQ-binding-like beta-propeller repeat protein, partial [Mycobacteriales bacterium]